MRALVSSAAALAMLAGSLGTAAPVGANEPVLHHVRYTVTANAPIWSHIYYRDTEPALFSDYSHNPYMFSPRADAEVGPGQPWVLEAHLADPNLWAMVAVQSGEAPNFPVPGYSCELAVDGVVVKTDSGPKGALCSIRNW